MRYPTYIDKLPNGELIKSTRLQYSYMFSVPTIYLMRIGNRTSSWDVPDLT